MSSADEAIKDAKAQLQSWGLHATDVFDSLARALGEVRAIEIMRGTRAKMGNRRLERSEDLLEFAELLVQQGGLIGVVGSSLRVRALLRGARAK